MLHQIKAPQLYTDFLNQLSLVMDSSISEVEFERVIKNFSVLENSRKLSLLEVLEKSLNFTRTCLYEPW